MLHWRISRSTSTFWPALMMAFSMKRAFSSPPQTMCAVRAGPDASCIASAMPMMPPLTVTLPPASTSAASMVPLTTTSPVTRTSMVALMSPRTCSEPSKLMLPVVRSTASTSTTGLTCTPWLISLGLPAIAARSSSGSSGSISTPDMSLENCVSAISSGSTGWPSTSRPSMPGSGECGA